ncbi:MAG: hypothetical protein AAB478_03450 [Patescibacteria group bacterium]
MSAEQRVYPVRDEAVVDAMQAAYTAKINLRRQQGREAFESGKYTPFAGFPDSFKNLFAGGFELEAPSQQQVIEQVVGPLQELASTYEVPAVFAGAGDLMPHVTLFNSPYKDLSPEDQAQMDAYLLSNRSHLGLISKYLTGLTFHMDTLVVGPNSYICAGEFDDEQGAPYKARKAIEAIVGTNFADPDNPGKTKHVLGRAATVFEREEQIDFPGGFGFPYGWDDIFHTSVSRVTDMVPSDRLLAFTDEAYATVGASLSAHPIPITVASVHMGRALV